MQDIYTADITTSIGITTENTRVFMTGGNNQYEKLKKYPDIKTLNLKELYLFIQKIPNGLTNTKKKMALLNDYTAAYTTQGI